jgi:hypothetical protein
MPRKIVICSLTLCLLGGGMGDADHPTSQQCIDKAAVQAVAAKRQLPITQLNWCQTGAEIAAR